MLNILNRSDIVICSAMVSITIWIAKEFSIVYRVSRRSFFTDAGLQYHLVRCRIFITWLLVNSDPEKTVLWQRLVTELLKTLYFLLYFLLPSVKLKVRRMAWNPKPYLGSCTLFSPLHYTRCRLEAPNFFIYFSVNFFLLFLIFVNLVFSLSFFITLSLISLLIFFLIVRFFSLITISKLLL